MEVSNELVMIIEGHLRDQSMKEVEVEKTTIRELIKELEIARA